jgi:phage terminase large subunit
MPFLNDLERDGIYEDDLHLVIVMNHSDNYWFPEELEQERLWDYQNLPRALYDHIWMGAFNDSVENAIIPAEWFDACIDAHIKLGFKPQGAIIATHDPSDGGDNKGYALRHGSVFIDIQEKTDGDVNEGMDWALDSAIGAGADFFAWDGDGMGAPLRRNADNALQGKKCTPVMFRGSEGPYMPEAIYQPTANTTIRQSAKIKDVFRNKRSQCYIRLQDRVYNTYRAVVHGEYCDPDELISFSSNIKCMGRLRSEVCRLPLKPNGNGFIQMMTKIEMKKLDIPSPGLSDSVMMSLGDFIVMNTRTSRAPRARKLHR